MSFDLLCAAGWALLAGMQVRHAWQGAALLPLLLALESLLIGYRLVVRRPDTAGSAPLGQRLVAWGSLFLPLAMSGSRDSHLGQALGIAGLLLTLWGLWALGASFGVAPADRRLVTAGPYRCIRHPMYAGALLNGLGFLLGNLTAWNGLVFALILLSAVLRIQWEERILFGYGGYAGQVRWRLAPGVW